MAEKRKKKSILRRLLCGEIIHSGLLKKYSGAVMLVMFFLLGYIANKFMCQLDMQTIKTLKTELLRVKTDYVNASASYYSRIRETEMKELVDSFGLELKSPECPPYRRRSK